MSFTTNWSTNKLNVNNGSYQMCPANTDQRLRNMKHKASPPIQAKTISSLKTQSYYNSLQVQTTAKMTGNLAFSFWLLFHLVIISLLLVRGNKTICVCNYHGDEVRCHLSTAQMQPEKHNQHCSTTECGLHIQTETVCYV